MEGPDDRVAGAGVDACESGDLAPAELDGAEVAHGAVPEQDHQLLVLVGVPVLDPAQLLQWFWTLLWWSLIFAQECLKDTQVAQADVRLRNR